MNSWPWPGRDSALRRALGDDVDDLERHHDFAGLIDYLDERGDRAAIGL